jgi:hypothetical protein
MVRVVFAPSHSIEYPMTRTPLAAILIFVSGLAFAQTPYAGMQTRPIKALSELQ